MAKSQTVSLSASRVATLAKIKDVKSRNQLRDTWMQEAQDKADKHAAFVETRRAQPFEHGPTENGAYFMKGSGTRYNFIVFSPERAAELLAELPALKKGLQSIVDGGSEE